MTCDAFGVLPPISRLTQAQAEYHFISGYTAKVAGTEMGVTEPEATFSPCFGGPFLVWHPGKYAELLSEKIEQHDTRVWLINTGWIGGGYGVGQRIRLSSHASDDQRHLSRSAGQRSHASRRRLPFENDCRVPTRAKRGILAARCLDELGGVRHGSQATGQAIRRQFPHVRRMVTPRSWRPDRTSSA